MIVIRQLPPPSTPLHYRIRLNTIEIDHDLERLASSAEDRAYVDRSSLLHFAWRGRPRPGLTLYVGIRKLGVGEELVCSPGFRPVIRRYWWPLYGHRLPKEDEALCDEAFERIDAAVGRDANVGRVTSKSQVSRASPALLLSGGVDSSFVAALMHRRGIPLTAFTIAFDDVYGLNETVFARRVARSLDINHHVVRVSVGDAGPLLNRVLAAPLPRASIAAVSHAALIDAVAQAGHVCILSGLGADECFGGFHKPLKHLAAQVHHMRRLRIDLVGLLAIPLLQLLRMREALFLGIAEFFSLRDLSRIACDAAGVRELAAADLEFYRGALTVKPDAHALELMAAHEYQYRLSELLLPAFGADQLGTALTLAYPFLDSDVYLWASALDPSRCYWYENNAWWAKRLLRATATRLLPDDIVMRNRQVFLAPVAHWLLARPVRAVIIEEIADSVFWKLDVLRREVRDRILAKLRQYRAIDPEDVWQEQLWVILVLCAWINRRESAAKSSLR